MAVRSLSRLAAGLAVTLALVSSSGQARGQGAALPLPPQEPKDERGHRDPLSLPGGVAGNVGRGEGLRRVFAELPNPDWT